ncbi:MAG: helix-turn-helix domain-containing protein [Bacteroidota bacterium]
MTQEQKFNGVTLINTNDLLAELIPAIHEAVENKFCELYKEENVWAKYPDFITVNLLAKEYFNVHVRTVVNWVNHGDLPPASRFKTVRGWQKNVIRDYLEKHPVEKWLNPPH